MTSRVEGIYNRYVSPRFWKDDVEIFRVTQAQEASGTVEQSYVSLGVVKAHFVTAGTQFVFGGKQMVIEAPTLHCKRSTDIKVDDKVKIGDEFYRVAFVNNRLKMKKKCSLVQLNGENFGGEIG